METSTQAFPTTKKTYAAIPDSILLDLDEEQQGLERIQCFLSKSDISVLDVLACQWNCLHKDGRPWRSRVLRRLAQGHTLADAVKAQEECRSLKDLVKQQAASITRLQQEKRESEGKPRIGRKKGTDILKKCGRCSFVKFSISLRSNIQNGCIGPAQASPKGCTRDICRGSKEDADRAMCRNSRAGNQGGLDNAIVRSHCDNCHCHCLTPFLQQEADANRLGGRHS